MLLTKTLLKLRSVRKIIAFNFKKCIINAMLIRFKWLWFYVFECLTGFYKLNLNFKYCSPPSWRKESRGMCFSCITFCCNDAFFFFNDIYVFFWFQTIFMFLISQLGGLKDPKNPAFKRYFYLLENLAYVKSFNMCFELEESQEIFCKLFKLLFNIVK